MAASVFRSTPGQYGGSLLTSFQLPEEKQAVGWSFTSFEEGEKIAVQLDTEQILAALAFDMGNGVQVFDCEILTREPERLEQAEYIVVIRACFDSEMEEGQAESETSEQPKPVLQLSDVTALSGKGEALSWADFEQYDCIETGSGLYIRLYPIDEMFTLSIGGAGPESEPMYIYLSAKDGTDEYIDIRTGDVEEYIRQHQDNPVVTDCSYSWQLSPVGFSDEAFFQMFGMDPENTGSPAVSAIRFLPVIRLESVEELDTFSGRWRQNCLLIRQRRGWYLSRKRYRNMTSLFLKAMICFWYTRLTGRKKGFRGWPIFAAGKIPCRSGFPAHSKVQEAGKAGWFQLRSPALNWKGSPALMQGQSG